MNEQSKYQDACPNTVQLSSNYVQFDKNGLSIELLTKNPKILKNHLKIF